MLHLNICYCCSVDKSYLTLMWSHGLQHPRLPCPSLSLRVCPNSCPLSLWCYLTISSSTTPFSFCLQSFPASGSFPMSWLFVLSGQIIGASVSASILPVNTQGWFPIINIFFLIWSSNPTAGHTHWGNQKGKRHVYPNVHRSTVYNSQDMEAT